MSLVPDSALPKTGRKTTIAALIVYPPAGLIALWCMDRFSKTTKISATVASCFWYFLFTNATTQMTSASRISLTVISLLAAAASILIWHKRGKQYIAQKYADHPKRQFKAAVYVGIIYVGLIIACWIPLVAKMAPSREAEVAGRPQTNSTSTSDDPEAETKARVQAIAESTLGSGATVDVYQRPEGSVGAGFYSVEAHYKTISASKGYIVPEIRRFYIALYTSPLGPKIWDAWVFVKTDLVDKFGNEAEDLIYKTALERDVSEKINWKSADMVDFPRVWKESYISRSLTE